MTSNDEEERNDKALENLKYSVQIIAEKATKELEVTKFAFRNFLYNNNFQLLFIFCTTVFMH